MTSIGPSRMTGTFLSGEAVENFRYGKSAKIKIHNSNNIVGMGIPSISNIKNEEVDNIPLQGYDCTKEVVLTVPDYLKYSDENRNGTKGTKFLIISLDIDSSESIQVPEMIIIAKV